MNSNKSNLEVKAKMSEQGADKAGLNISIAAIIAASGVFGASVALIINAVRWW